MMTDEQRAEWGRRIEAMARPVVDAVNVDQEIEREVRRPYSIAGPLLLHCAKRGGHAPAMVRENPRKNPDLALWWSHVDPSYGVPDVIDIDATGSLFDQGGFTALEVWTETELSGLHALSHVHRIGRHATDKIQVRMRRAVEFHLENTQPDNATNHPWAIHVFVEYGTPESRPRALMHADANSTQSGR